MVNLADGNPADRRFRWRERVRLRADFARVFDLKCRVSDTAMIVYIAPNGLAWSRLGRSVSERIGNAVVRNYVRRRSREAFRLQKDRLPKGLDIVCVARPTAARRDCDLAESLCDLVGRAAQRLAKRRSKRE